MRLCRCCNEQKSIDMYRKQTSGDGYGHICKDCRNAKGREWYVSNQNKKLEYAENYRKNNRQSVRNSGRRWREKNPGYSGRYSKHKYHTDPLYRSKHLLRSRVANLLRRRGEIKDSSYTKLVGCTMERLFQHIGPRPAGADHDHICPLSQAKTLDELKKLCHYTNIRWLDHALNVKKGNSATDEAVEKCKLLLGRDWIVG
jgi:hypothetical protein